MCVIFYNLNFKIMSENTYNLKPYWEYKVNTFDAELLKRRVMWDPQDGCEVRLWFQGEYE